MTDMLMAGAGRCDITPAPGTPQGGWGAQTHQRGQAADMPLYATALVLGGSGETVAIVDVDAIGFDRAWTDRIIDAIAGLTGIGRDRIRLSCTHTHSGPNTFRLLNISEGREMILAYLEDLPHRIAGAVWQAQRNLRPVRCGAAEGSCAINVNRRFTAPEGQVVVGRNWSGAVERTVRVVRFDDLEERPVVTIVHYACHGTTAGWENQRFTPDFPGPARQVMERQLGGTCLFLQGAAGDIGPRRGFTGDLGVYRALGTQLGLAAATLAAGIETLPRTECFDGVLQSGTGIALYRDEPVEPPVPVLRVLSPRVPLPLKQFPPPDKLEPEMAVLATQLEQARTSGTEEEVRAATARITQAGWRAANARLYHGQPTLGWRMQGIRIGDVALVSVEGEPFNAIARAVAAASPFPHTLFSGYSNGGFGYIPVREAYSEGGYEIEATPFAPEAADALVSAALVMLRELAAEV